MVRILNGIWVRLFTMMPIPITPPSKIVQGTRNSSMANAAMAAPPSASESLKTVAVSGSVLSFRFLLFYSIILLVSFFLY